MMIKVEKLKVDINNFTIEIIKGEKTQALIGFKEMEILDYKLTPLKNGSIVVKGSK